MMMLVQPDSIWFQSLQNCITFFNIIVKQKRGADPKTCSSFLNSFYYRLKPSAKPFTPVGKLEIFVAAPVVRLIP